MSKLFRTSGLLGLTVLLSAVFTGCSEPPAVESPEEKRAVELADGAWELVAASFPDAKRPDIERVRFVSQAEYTGAMYDCLREEGVDVALSIDGDAFEITSIPEQAESTAVSLYTCKVRFPLDQSSGEPLDSESIAELYRHYVDELTPCLEREGFVIPPPPSRQTFLEEWPDLDWNPYFFVEDSDLGDFETLRLACPPAPDSLE
jgi:hypothetical protein